MTAQEIIEKVRAEVNRLKKQLVRGACAAQIEMETSCKDEAYDEMLSILSDLEKECEEKPTPAEGLDMEIDRYFRNMKLRANTPPIPDEYIDEETADKIARHFYELGKQSKKRELLPMIERICVSCPEKVKAESALNKFTSKYCVHCSIEHCPGVKACYTSSNEQLQ